MLHFDLSSTTYESLIVLHLIWDFDHVAFAGNTSSLLCLCGISVSLAFCVLYLKFYPRFYHSVFLKRVIKRLLQRQANSVSNRKKRLLQHTTSSVSNDTCDNNNVKSSDAVCTIKKTSINKLTVCWSSFTCFHYRRIITTDLRSFVFPHYISYFSN